jgi:hypothetical protein
VRQSARLGIRRASGGDLRELIHAKYAPDLPVEKLRFGRSHDASMRWIL